MAHTVGVHSVVGSVSSVRIVFAGGPHGARLGVDGGAPSSFSSDVVCVCVCVCLGLFDVSRVIPVFFRKAKTNSCSLSRMTNMCRRQGVSVIPSTFIVIDRCELSCDQQIAVVLLGILMSDVRSRCAGPHMPCDTGTCCGHVTLVVVQVFRRSSDVRRSMCKGAVGALAEHS